MSFINILNFNFFVTKVEILIKSTNIYKLNNIIYMISLILACLLLFGICTFVLYKFTLCMTIIVSLYCVHHILIMSCFAVFGFDPNNACINKLVFVIAISTFIGFIFLVTGFLVSFIFF